MAKKEYKGYYNIVENTANNEHTIYMYGVIGGFDFDKWETINTSEKFIEDFKAIDKEENTIHVKINTPGGDIWEGLPICNTIKSAKATVITYVDGIAFSMGSLIALSGDKVVGYKNSMFMFHNALTFARGNANDLRKEAEVLDKYDEALISILSEKINITEEEAKEKYFNYSDNYFVGTNAQNLGLFDEIISEDSSNVPINIQQLSPMNLMEQYAALNFSIPKTTNSNNNYKNMSQTKKQFPKLQAVLGMSAPFDSADNVYLQETQVDQVENALADAYQKTTDVQTKLDAANTTTTAFTNKLDAACKTHEVENYQNLTTEAKLDALSGLVTEYGAFDGAGKTKVNAGENKNEVEDSFEDMPAYEKDAYAMLGKNPND